METYTQLGLRRFPRKLARAAKKAASQREMTLTDFVALAVTQVLSDPHGSSSVDLKLERDLAWYESHRNDLATRYPEGENLAIVDQRVVDHDPNAETLASRLREKYGRRSIVMPQLGERRPLRRILSPRRA
jgi:hypothetical protein